jgi:hypothetical protein
LRRLPDADRSARVEKTGKPDLSAARQASVFQYTPEKNENAGNFRVKSACLQPEVSTQVVFPVCPEKRIEG